jgi:hypothetical protein
MADDHMSLTVSSNGTLYCAAKTSYNDAGFPQLILLVRRPTTPATWDNLYAVTVNDGTRLGTQAIVLLNDVLGRLKVVFTTQTNGGDIAYRETSTSVISFGPTKNLIGSGTLNYNFSSSTHQTYNPDVVIVATDITLSNRPLVSVLASDLSSPPPSTQSLTAIKNSNAVLKQELKEDGTNSFKIIPTLVKRGAKVFVTTTSKAVIEVMVSDSYGRSVYTSRFAGTTWIETGKMISGIYFVILREKNKTEAQKIMIID